MFFVLKNSLLHKRSEQSPVGGIVKSIRTCETWTLFTGIHRVYGKNLTILSLLIRSGRFLRVGVLKQTKECLDNRQGKCWVDRKACVVEWWEFMGRGGKWEQ